MHQYLGRQILHTFEVLMCRAGCTGQGQFYYNYIFIYHTINRLNITKVFHRWMQSIHIFYLNNIYVCKCNVTYIKYTFDQVYAKILMWFSELVLQLIMVIIQVIQVTIYFYKLCTHIKFIVNAILLSIIEMNWENIFSYIIKSDNLSHVIQYGTSLCRDMRN